MKPSTNPVLVGIIAGLVAAILLVVSAFVPVLVFISPFIALTIIFVACLGFGNSAGYAAILASFVVIGLFAGSIQAGLWTALPLLPALAMSYAANLARPASEIGGPEASMAWYPLSDILLIGAICSGVLMMFVFLVLVQDIDYAAAAELWGQMMERIQPDAVVTPDMKANMAAFMQNFAPSLYAGIYLLVLFACFYFAIRILAARRWNIRPREDIRSSLRMNRLAILIFLGGIALAFASPPLSTIGAIFIGATVAGFMLAGYAVIHEAVRGKAWAYPALFMLYFVTFFLLPILAFIICVAGGLANPRRAVAITPANSNETSDTQN
jgi:hypothetical protein